MRDVSTLLEQRRSVFTDNYTVISSQAVYETRLIEGEREREWRRLQFCAQLHWCHSSRTTVERYIEADDLSMLLALADVIVQTSRYISQDTTFLLKK